MNDFYNWNFLNIFIDPKNKKILYKNNFIIYGIIIPTCYLIPNKNEDVLKNL